MLKWTRAAFARWMCRVLGVDETSRQISNLEHVVDGLFGSIERLTEQVDDLRSLAVPSNLHQRLSAIEASLRFLEARIALVESLSVSIDGGHVTTLGEHAKKLADAAAAATQERHAISAAKARGMTLDEYLDMRRKKGSAIIIPTTNKAQ